jgi:hypothetical protein
MGGALRRGGRHRLAVLIDRYGGDLAADFADRGLDLPQLWRARRYAYILAIADRLPRDSHFVAAVADDDEIATGDEPKAAPPSLTEFGPVTERLTGIYDLLGILIALQSAPPGKKPRLPRPLARPVTAAQRARDRAAEADRQFLASKLFPGRG